ncbi:uncharacterized protein LOC100829964 isoform X2 [Brachypodium distachyon]|uniref:uncharacterized protein LOC100829964 isoform X2 n=1 Tax=Brachypodium distachyon TaxID=15368 RepID=UPI00052FE169|nr:uncharacterized protein LOC100829964 isoform X2 [Brachypodium distachyon]|eukprot:XP_010239726.1 uncharacterized protein LOC100829964 isoform X2 [Brachypodium distachyon]
MDPPPPYDHHHHRRHGGGGHHYVDQQHHHFAGGSSISGGATVRSRHEYGSYEPLPPAPYGHLHHHHHHHHNPPRHQQHQQQLPPPPPLPPPPSQQPHRYDGPSYAPPLPAPPPEPYSTPPPPPPPPQYSTPPPPPPTYHSPAPHHHYHHAHQRHGDEEIRRAAGHHHHHNPQHQHHHHHQQQQLQWEEAEDDRRRYAPTHQLRMSPPGPRKRQRCALHDGGGGDVESTSSSGPPPSRYLRQQPHPNYAPQVDSFVDRSPAHLGYSHESYSTHSDGRKVQMPLQTTLSGSPRATIVAHPRRTPQKVAPRRLSVWQRIEESPAASTRQLPKDTHISPRKSNNTGSASKELASVISVDCKAKSAGSNDGNSSKGVKKDAGKKIGKVLASVLVKPSPESKEKREAVKKISEKHDNVQKSVAGSTSKDLGLAAQPVTGVKKVKKIVIKKIVRKIGGKDQQISSSIVSGNRNSIDNANTCEKEEGEIIMSSAEKDIVSVHNSVSTSDTDGAGNGAAVQTDENNNVTNPRKRKIASTIESVAVSNPAGVSVSEHPGNEDDRRSMGPADYNAASAGNTRRTEHPGKDDRSSMDSAARNSAFLFKNDNYQEEEEEGEILSLSGEMNVAVASNPVGTSDQCKDSSMGESKVCKGVSEKNNTCMDGVIVNHDTPEVCGSKDTRREGNGILIGTNKEDVLRVSNFIAGPSTTEVTNCEREGAQKNEDMILTGSVGKSVPCLDETLGTPGAIEVDASQDAREEEGNMLTHPCQKGFVYVNSRGTLHTTEFSASENIQDKEGRMPMVSSEGNVSVTHHVKVSYTRELSLNKDTRKKESQFPIDSCQTSTLEIMHHLEAPSTTEAIMSKIVGEEVGMSPTGSNDRHPGTSNSTSTLEFNLADRTKDSHMEDLDDETALNETDAPRQVEGRDFFNLPSSRNIGSTNVPSLNDDPMEDSTSDIILNNGVERGATTQVAELINLHRGHLSPEIDFVLAHSCESSSVSGNSEQSVPTALTLGSNFYFSTTESEGQPEENHELLNGQQGLDVATVTEFDSLVTRKVVADDDLMGAGVQNWLTLPPTVNNIAIAGKLLANDATVTKDRIGLDQSVDDATLVSQDHDITQDMYHCGSMDAFSSQVNSIRLSGSDMPQSDPLTPKVISEDVDNDDGIVLSGLHSVSSINVLDQSGHTMVDVPTVNPIDTALGALESTDVMDAELVSPQVSVEPDHTYDSNTEGPVVDSSTNQDSLSSWIGSIVSEAKKDHQPCKSTLPSISFPDKILASEEDSRRAVLDSVAKSVVKSPQTNVTSSLPPKVVPKQVNIPSLSREPPRSSQNARHKTWHRGDMASSASSHGSQPSGLPPKQPPRRNGKIQNSYIRKGNALIRNPATGSVPASSSNPDTQNKLNKPVMRRSMNFVRKVDSNDSMARSNFSVERPKTPPLPLHAKFINPTMNLPEQSPQTLHKQHSPETEKEESVGKLYSGVDFPSIKSAQKSEPSDTSKVVYVRPKSNQLVAAQRQDADDSINSAMDKVLSLQPHTSSDFYLKNRKNQIILSSSSLDGQSTKEITTAKNSNSGENKGVHIASSNNSITVFKDIPRKALQTTNNMGSFSHVWTLNGQQPQRKVSVATGYMKASRRILPWKRKIYYKNFRSSHPQNVSSLRLVRLLQAKKRDMVYTVSTDGFTIRKSPVLSVGGSSLKWSRSLEKRSQKVNEEATRAVSDVQRMRREKWKQLTERSDQYSVSVDGNKLMNNNQASSDLRRSSTCNEYVRVSKGNQLVRNPKKVIRMLANEKVRWSLHTVRSRRLPKKPQYCQFFTRFGECKKPEGQCRYIHDRAKVTICTKFLKGLCSDTSCKLTHQVLPERMQDCSYFLRGLCTNTACPYRHVKVNSNAPACEDFLKGYCADGDECRRKHTYVCPVFEATGECAQQSSCKLHHPKKLIKSKRSRPDTPQNSSWGRYFDTNIGHDRETRKASSDQDHVQKLQHVFSGGDFVDFIRLDSDGVAEDGASDGVQLMELDSEDLNAQADSIDALIKPLRIMRTARV